MQTAAFRANADIAIHVDDLGAARAFYVGVLGLPLVEQSATHLAVDAGAFRLWINYDPAERRSFVPSFDVPDATAAREVLLRAGCQIAHEGHAGGFYARDPFGFVFDVIERRPRA